MSARFEVEVLGRGELFRVCDEYWDREKVVSLSDEQTATAGAVRLVVDRLKKGDTHRWFAVGECGHSHIFEMPTKIYAIPGRHLRYRNQNEG